MLTCAQYVVVLQMFYDAIQFKLLRVPEHINLALWSEAKAYIV